MLGARGAQFARNIWDSGPSKTVPGTKKHPQGRLFKPEYTGDPHRFEVEKWMSSADHLPTRVDAVSPVDERPLPSEQFSDLMQSPKRDVIGWHTNLGDLPDYDDQDRVGFAGHVKADREGRAYVEGMGSLVGTHFGTVEAGADRHASSDRLGKSMRKAHPVKLDKSKIHPKLLSDTAANHSDDFTDMVEDGKALFYRNDVEDAGSLSFRVLRDEVKTWGEDVTEYARGKSQFHGVRPPHPSYTAAAEAGYEPVVRTGKELDRLNDPAGYQNSLDFGAGGPVPRGRYLAKDSNSQYGTRLAEFYGNPPVELRKPRGGGRDVSDESLNQSYGANRLAKFYK